MRISLVIADYLFTAQVPRELAAEQQTEIAEAQLARSEEFRQFISELLGSIEPDRRFPERSQAIRDLIDTAYDRLKAGNVKDVDARREVVDAADIRASARILGAAAAYYVGCNLDRHCCHRLAGCREAGARAECLTIGENEHGLCFVADAPSDF